MRFSLRHSLYKNVNTTQIRMSTVFLKFFYSLFRRVTVHARSVIAAGACPELDSGSRNLMKNAYNSSRLRLDGRNDVGISGVF